MVMSKPSLKAAGALISSSARHWIADDASTIGAALAFFCAFSIAPLLVILLSIAELIVGRAAATAHISTQLIALFGPATAKTLFEAMKNSNQAQGIVANVISAVTLA